MPGGTWNAAGDTYSGAMYRTTGPPGWTDLVYDPSLLKVIQAGTYSITFTASGATFNYNVDGRTGTLQLVREPF
jgi:hypothetical protein